MKLLTRGLIWVGLFLLCLGLRFPYRAAFEGGVRRLEQRTGADLAWEELGLGPTGIVLQGFSLRSPTGASVEADQAVVRPAWGGVVAVLSQTRLGSSARARFEGSRLTLQAEQLQVDSGSPDLKTIRLTGALRYDLTGREGGGELRMSVPGLVLPPPLPTLPLEVGARLKIQPQAEAAGQEVEADLSLQGQDLSGGGKVRMTSQTGGQPPILSGQLDLETPLGPRTIRLGGTWSRPRWELAAEARP